LLAACQNQQEPASANNSAAAAPQAKAAAPRADPRAVAEQVVRRQLRNPPGLIFSNARVVDPGRVPIVCGDVERNGRRERYIVVDGEAAWIESQTRPGTMDEAVREHCGDGERG
jgi:hypothetical protein